AVGHWAYEVGAFTDHFATWHDEVTRKRAVGGEDLASEVAEGALLLRDAAELEEKLDLVLDQDLLAAVERHPDRGDFTTSEVRLAVDVERERARFGSWYELFPRSWGGFAGVQK